MRKITIILSIICLCFLLYTVVNCAPKGHAIENLEPGASHQARSLPFKEGESFTYEVRYSGLKIGKSILTFNGEKELNGRKVYHITFFTKIPSLKDTEEIYADKDTFLPIEVHRKIKKKIGFSDNVVEKYDQVNFKVDIKQKSKLRSRNFSIQKDSPVHNAILLAYFYRVKKAFNENERTKIALPTVDFDVMFSGIEAIKTPMGEYRAYVFTSEPPRFRLWLSADEKRIPLKIKNPGTLGYSLVIRSID